MNANALVYLASPYSSPDPAVKEKRFKDVCRAAGWLMHDGIAIFCPIAHSHPIDAELAEFGDHEFWLRQDFAVLRHCGAMFVLMLDGWKESHGVRKEIEFAQYIGLPVVYIEPHEVGV